MRHDQKHKEGRERARMLASSSSASCALCWDSQTLKRSAAAAWNASSASAGTSASAPSGSAGSSGAALLSSAGACLRFLLLDFCGAGELHMHMNICTGYNHPRYRHSVLDALGPPAFNVAVAISEGGGSRLC